MYQVFILFCWWAVFHFMNISLEYIWVISSFGILNKATINIYSQVLCKNRHSYISWVNTQAWNYWVSVCIALKETAKFFCKVFVSFFLLIGNIWVLVALHPCRQHLLVSAFCFLWPFLCVVVFCISFSCNMK